MKTFALILVALVVLRSSAQPVRLAVVVESPEAVVVGDVLTAELSKNERVQLLERGEVEKVYREQGLSAGNRDYLKLGQVLGADGLWLFEVNRSKWSTNLMARLVAVKPGVVLLNESFSWPLAGITEWAPSAIVHAQPFFPKLGVLPRDAIPISVVNLRSAVSSADSVETERQLKLLVIQRLSREARLFVLERQRMGQLSEEKGMLGMDEAPFWKGSYLLEGVVDQNGYAKETMTIDARLTPSRGGAPLLLEVKGSRSDLGGVINQLAEKVNEALKVASTVKAWKAADEAGQYFEEAKWALKWGVLGEAQAAVDSAWALGKQDLECANLRVRSYAEESPKVVPENPRYYESAKSALSYYYEFTRNSPAGEPKVVFKDGRWQNSDWYQTGIDALETASRVLQQYYFQPTQRKLLADKLTELRSLARSVSEIISSSPSVRERYYVGDRFATGNELFYTIGVNRRIYSNKILILGTQGSRDIFDCQVNWGCFWQETPAGCAELYRKLMDSPVFCYLHDDFWFRDPLRPRFTGWNGASALPTVWGRFFHELETSTNLLLRLEAKALRLVDADEPVLVNRAFTNLFATIKENQQELAWNNVEIFYSKWCLDGLAEVLDGADPLASPGSGRSMTLNMADGPVGTREDRSFVNRFNSDHRPVLEAIDREYRERMSFVAQVKFLKDDRPYNFFEFSEKFFGEKNYSRERALVLQPLLETYKSNLIVRAEAAPVSSRNRGERAMVEQLQRKLAEVIDPSLTHAPVVIYPRISNSVPRFDFTATGPPRTVNVVTNILLVQKVLKIPIEQAGYHDVRKLRIQSFRWTDGKLLLDLRFRAAEQYNAPPAVFALFDPASEKWKFVPFPEISPNGETHILVWNVTGRNLEFFQNSLYLVERGLSRYDLQARRWEKLDIPDLPYAELFAVDGHLYAANGETIVEIIGGKSIRILASTRRRPAVSLLDSFESFGDRWNLGHPALAAWPFMFSPSKDNLFASIREKIFRWNGKDWNEVLSTNCPGIPGVFGDLVVFHERPRGETYPGRLWVWDASSSASTLFIRDKPQERDEDIMRGKKNLGLRTPIYQTPTADLLATAPITCVDSNFYFLVDHATITNISTHWTVREKDGYHAQLICLNRQSLVQTVIPLKFDTALGQPTLQHFDPRFGYSPRPEVPIFMASSGDSLFLGQMDTMALWVVPFAQIRERMVQGNQ